MGLKERVGDLMKQGGLKNQSQLAKLSGLTQATVSRILVGKVKRVRPETLSGLARALGVTVDALLTEAHSLSKEEEGRLIEQAFRHVLSDPQFKYGTRLKGQYDLAAKRFIIEMYEKTVGRQLLLPSKTEQPVMYYQGRRVQGEKPR